VPPLNRGGRLPRQGSGPDANSALITATMISTPPASAPDPGRWHIDDLPAHLAAQVAIDPETGEWIWTGRIDRDGYGRYSGQGVHRLVYLALVGPIPAGLEIDHVKVWGCTSRACCSPWHLEPVTRRENTLRGDSFAGINARKTRCDHGHLYTPANTYWSNGRRDCRRCIRRRVAEYKHRLQQQAEPGLALFPASELGRAA
jgi:hypothetical protein